MPRYPADHSAETRERILEASDRLLKERGAGRSSIAEVMQAAGLTVGGFYAHFASKQALEDATILYGLGASMERLLAPLEAIADDRQWVRALIGAYLDDVDDRRPGQRLLALARAAGCRARSDRAPQRVQRAHRRASRPRCAPVCGDRWPATARSGDRGLRDPGRCRCAGANDSGAACACPHSPGDRSDAHRGALAGRNVDRLNAQVRLTRVRQSRADRSPGTLRCSRPSTARSSA